MTPGRSSDNECVLLTKAEYDKASVTMKKQERASTPQGQVNSRQVRAGVFQNKINPNIEDRRSVSSDGGWLASCMRCFTVHSYLPLAYI